MKVGLPALHVQGPLFTDCWNLGHTPVRFGALSFVTC